MAARRTKVVLEIPWDDETEDHPAQWGWDVLIDTAEDVHVIDFEDLAVNDR